jgi:hypothetical protein
MGGCPEAGPLQPISNTNATAAANLTCTLNIMPLARCCGHHPPCAPIRLFE